METLFMDKIKVFNYLVILKWKHFTGKTFWVCFRIFVHKLFNLVFIELFSTLSLKVINPKHRTHHIYF